MAHTSDSSSLSPTEARRAPWAISILLTILFHFFLMRQRVDWNTAPASPRVEVQQVDPKKLEAIRKQWKHEQQQSLLIDKNPSLPRDPKDAEAPRDARYFSDRNIRVEKEQRAKQRAALPSPQQQQPTARARQNLPSLGNLGVPLHLSQPALAASQNQAQEPLGADQDLLERDLPEGSENLLNAQESVFYSFYHRLYQAIAPVWQRHIRQVAPPHPLQPGDYSTTVEVVFDTEGNLVEVKTLQSSGIQAFDQAVDTAWKFTPRFPNPPQGLLNPTTGKIHMGWTFTVQVGQGFGMQYGPPSRVF